MSARHLLCAALSIGATAAQARPDKQITPYLEVSQVVTADLKGDSDVLTYTSLAAGIDASVVSRNAEAQLSYRYERRIAWNDDLGDSDVHSGIGRARVTIARGLSIEAGGIAARARSDIRGAAPAILAGNVDNVAQVYSAYAGPTYAGQVGALDVTAAYRLGYTKVESNDGLALPAGQPRLDNFDDSVSHYAAASVGMSPANFPVGWQISGAFEREDAGQLDQRYEGKFVRADVTLPVSPAVALIGGAGYEDIEISQRDALRDASGAPIVNGAGRFRTDPASPRLLAYDQDGLIWDVGVLWRPSRRTSLEARVGRRYGSMIYTGSFTHQVNGDLALAIGVYDGLQSFSRQLNDNLAALPTQFNFVRNPLTDNVGACVFGANGAGGCLNDAFQSISTSQFRARGVTGVLSLNRGRWNAGLGIGYAQRVFITPRSSQFFALDGLKDESFFAEATLGRRLDEQSSIEASLYANYFDSGIAQAPDVTSTGATAAYYRMIGRRISATAALGLYTSDQDGFESDVNGSALVGMRYTF